MISPLSDELLTMSQAAKICPKVDGKRPHVGSLWRWARRGVRGVKLEHVMVGRKLCTSRAALDAFFANLTDAPRSVTSGRKRSPKPPSELHREAQVARARQRMLTKGFLKEETRH